MQFFGLMLRVVLFIIIGALVIIFSYRQLNAYHSNQNELLEQKEAIIKQIDNRFNQAFFDFRGYFAFNNESLRDNAYKQEEEIRTLLDDFKRIENNAEDHIFYENVESYLNIYYGDLVPEAMTFFEQRDRDNFEVLANDGGTEAVNTFKKEVQDYRNKIDDQIEANYELLVQRNSYILIFVGLYLIGIMFVLFRLTRTMFKNVGKPLSDFAEVANEVASGNDADVAVITNREDELGKLSVAFKKMLSSLQEKEQDLLGQNEELIAQQDELEAQRFELEQALSNLKRSENNLRDRNEFVKGISNSLDKQNVLDEIVVNMCKITQADQGIICFLNDQSYAAYGISQTGKQQFLNNLDNGLNDKLIKYKESFTVKRELIDMEKGFHEAKSYGYDLYLPILDIENEVIAVLVLSRFGSAFPEDQMDEYNGFAKQISISLENIQMYDQSEEDRNRNQDILNTVLEGIQLVDVDGNALQVNHMLCQIFDCTEATNRIIGTSLDKWSKEMARYIENEDDFLAFFEQVIHSADSEATHTYTLSNTNKIYKVYANSLYHDNEKIGTVFVHRDITKETEVDQMKSEFVSTVSHELRTPLASIYGYTELMLNRELKPKKQKKYLTTIYQETKRLTNLINDFLDVQRMESGRQTYEQKYIDLLDVIKDVVKTQKVATDIHEFDLSVETQDTTVLGDKDKLKQIFTNLINNAIKYSPNGGNISIRLYREDDHMKTSVTDEGLGIPEDALDKLFSKFYRVDNSDRRSIGGTGLGLSIVKEIALAHNGDVQVVSEYGQGSSFTVTFPVVETLTNSEPLSPQTDSEKAYNVYIIEDDKHLTGLLEQELRENNFYVQSFTKAANALEQIKNVVPHAIVLDLNLEAGEMDGWEFMRELKRMDVPYSNIPIIISSALDEQDKGFQLGVTNYFVKPYRAIDLSRTLLQTLLEKEKRGQIFIPDTKKDS